MDAPLPLPPPGFDDLEIDEKLAYIDQLYRLVGAKPGDGIPAWQKQILDARIAAHDAEPAAARPWRESMERVRTELHKRRT